MRSWMMAVATVAMLAGSGVLGFPVSALPSSPGDTPEMAALRVRLAEREAELQALQTRLLAYDDGPFYLEAEATGVVDAVRASRLPDRQQRRLAVAIVREARRNGLDPLLVVALIRCESSFDNYAVSSVGAMGLMQVMPGTGTYLADKAGMDLRRHSNLFDSETNVELGTAYLADLIQRFGSLERALVAYNAGPGLAKRILAKRDVRVKFMAGYPAKVVREYQKLKAQQERQLSLRAKQQVGGQG
ncbi:lytic transglycosylase domain-containing protein [Myxococcaceae bacterium GXIMD 01537]